MISLPSKPNSPDDNQAMKLPILRALLDPIPDDPFYQPRRPLWAPAELLHPPPLPPAASGAHPQSRFALLINPFYPKDPHASFGKHVLTPSLALTSIAGATPAG